MIDAVGLHPQFCGVTCMFRIVILPKPVTVWVFILQKWEQVSFQYHLITQAFHIACENADICSTSAGNASPHMHLECKCKLSQMSEQVHKG